MKLDGNSEGRPELWVVRHGETEWNAEMRMQGQLDTGLSARGRWQASRAAGPQRNGLMAFGVRQSWRHSSTLQFY